MKKSLALFLCALMVAAAVSCVSAVDYIVNKDFEANAEGPYVKENNQLTISNKGFIIDVAKIGDTKALKFDRQNYDKSKHSGADSFAQIMHDGPAKNGVASKYVISYDFMIEKADGVKNADGTWASQSAWQVAMIRMTPAAGTQFQHTAIVYGTELWVATKGGNPDYEAGKPAAVLEKNKWYNLAVVVNMEGKSFSVYLNGDTIVENQAWSVADTSATPEQVSYIRLAWTGSGDGSYNGVAYVDNIKAYNADKPENATGKVYGAAAETTKPAEPAKTEVSVPTADIAVVLAAVSAVAASGVIVFKKRK